MVEKLTKTQSDLHNTLFTVTDEQRTFASNYGEAVATLRRGIVHDVTVATIAGLVLGGLVGGLVGARRS